MEFEPVHLRWLEDRLTEKRYRHSLAVGERAAFLAGIHGEDADKAALAGLLHDCCHCLPHAQQLKIINSHGIMLDNFTAAQPQLWHAIAGGHVIADELEITDTEVISAVRYHTTGAAGMTKLNQIVYLADLTSPDRDYPGVEKYRRLADQSLSRCMLADLSRTLGRLAGAGAPVVRDTWEAYNFFWSIINERNCV